MNAIKLRPTKEAIINAVNILECLIRSGEQHETYWKDENGDGCFFRSAKDDKQGYEFVPSDCGMIGE